MRQTYDGREPVFDLARLESSRPGAPDRVSSSFKGQTAYGLLPEYTTDGGHLTGPAEKLIAAEFLRFLANVAVQRDAERDASERPLSAASRRHAPAPRCNLYRIDSGAGSVKRGHGVESSGRPMWIQSDARS